MEARQGKSTMKTVSRKTSSSTAPDRRGPRPINRLGSRRRLLLGLEPCEIRTLLSAFIVSSTADSGAGSLRQAIIDSNAAVGQTNQIDFALPGLGLQSITPTSPLPAITQSVLIDGWSQPGCDGTPLIELNGSDAGIADGLTIMGSEITVRGLAIDDFSSGSGIVIWGPNATGNWLYGNAIGTDPAGTHALPNLYGIQIDGGATDNLVGGTAAGTANVISGNSSDGVVIDGGGTSGNVVEGNLIGTDGTGTTAFDSSGNALGNGYDGILIDGGANANTIGGTATGALNVISGNGNDGIAITQGGTTDNVVEGNLIGTDITGTTAYDANAKPLGNSYDGVYIAAGASANTIGGTTADARNVLSGNVYDGVLIIDSGTSANVVEGDYIGTNAAGNSAYDANGKPVGNGYEGVSIDSGATANTVGGTAAGAGNVISGNQDDGVLIYSTGADGNLVEGNLIGTDPTGSTTLDSNGQSLGNSGDGVYIAAGASDNTIGGTAAGAANLISGNMYDGVAITDGGTTGNLVAGNLIGTDITGTAAYNANGKPLGNSYDGVYIASGAIANTIGGTTAGAINVISGNVYDGVLIIDAGTSANVVEGDYIGTNAAGSSAYDANGRSLGNGYEGVSIDSGATANTVGGTAAGAANVISGNQDDGVLIYSTGALGNVVEGNLIGTDATGTTTRDANGQPLGNVNDGVAISAGASDNTIGGTTAGAANLISGNMDDGVAITDGGTMGNLVAGNLIGTDITGTTAYDANGKPLGNSYDGVYIASGASANTIGGTTADARNVLSGNVYDGVLIIDTGTSANVVEGDYIGTNAAGNSAYDANGKSLGNGYEGVSIDSGATANTVGGTAAGAGNVISGNQDDGVLIYGTGALGNVVEGNFIGTDAAGTTTRDASGQSLGNGNDGIAVSAGASDNTIGGSLAAARNVVSGNANEGVGIDGDGTTGNLVEGNYLGTDAKGTTAYDPNGHPLGNSYDGVYIAGGASGNTVGGSAAFARNIISGNMNYGVVIEGAGSSSNTVEGNYIGTDRTGTTAFDSNGNPFGNGYDGVYLTAGAANNTIGGTTAGAGNLISGDANDGVEVDGRGTSGNLVAGNFIGTSVTGNKALPNGTYTGPYRVEDDGVAIDDGASNNTIGGTTPAARNVISGNLGDGVQILDYGSTGNVVEGNLIGTSVSGDTALPNGTAIPTGNYDHVGGDVVIAGSASGDWIDWIWGGSDNQNVGYGGPTLIPSNTGVGVEFADLGTGGNIVQANSIELSGGVLSFMISAGASEPALDLGPAAPVVGLGSAPEPSAPPVPSGPVLQIARLADVSGTALDLIATFVTLTVVPGNLESELESSGGGAELLASIAPAGSTGLGQGPGRGGFDTGEGSATAPSPEAPSDTAAGQAVVAPDRLPAWARFAAGLDDDWPELRARIKDATRESTAPGPDRDGPALPSPGASLETPSGVVPANGTDPSRPETTTGRALDRGESPLLRATNSPPLGTRHGAVRPFRKDVGADFLGRLNDRPLVAAVDAAVEELGGHVSRADREIRALPSSLDASSGRTGTSLPSITATSVPLAMTWELAVKALRAHHEARVGGVRGRMSKVRA
jgi:hypothetical protein